MKQEVKINIEKLFSLLTENELEQELLEFSKTNNEVVYSFLENVGTLHATYNNTNNNSPLIKEVSGSIHLWHKSLNGIWKVNLYNINRVLNTQ